MISPAKLDFFLLVQLQRQWTITKDFDNVIVRRYTGIMKTKCEYSGTLFIISRKYFSVFRGPHLPLDTPFWTRCFPLVMQFRKAGFPFAAPAWKREPCFQRYVSRMTRTENFLSQFFFKNFLETTFIHVLWYAVHY